MQYYERLRDTREDLDITREEVAKQLGTNQQQIYRYEKGLQDMTVDRFLKLCIIYNVSADYILGLKGMSRPR